jgi:RNA-binding protein YhbY
MSDITRKTKGDDNSKEVKRILKEIDEALNELEIAKVKVLQGRDDVLV